MSKKVNLSKEDIEKYYIEELHTVQECADHFKVSKSTFQKYTEEYGIKKDRTKNWVLANKLPTKEQLLDSFEKEGLSETQVAKKFNLAGRSTVKNLKKYYGINSKDFDRKNLVLRSSNQRKATCLKKYGVESASQLSEVKSKLKNTCKKKYGVDSYSKSEEFKKRKAQISEEKAKTSLAHYGVPHYKQVGMSKEYLSAIKSKQSLLNFFESLRPADTAEEAAKKLGCQVYLIYYWIKKYGLEETIKRRTHVSSGENDICAFLDKLGVTYRKSDRESLNNGQEIDIYCPDFHIGIEFNGIYWHSELFKPKKYHFDKTITAASRGIRLIHIYENEWNFNKEKIKEFLRIIFGKVEKRIYARKCEIREITNKEARPFNEKTHLQGHRNAQITCGLFYNGELVQLMSFSKTKYNKNLKGDNSWEIIRGCPGSNNIVVGGVGKLFSYFVKKYSPDQVFSYCDFNKFDGKSYEAIGMQFVGYTGPDKSYVSLGSVIKRDPKKYKENIKNSETAIWGAGSKKYLWKASDKR